VLELLLLLELLLSLLPHAATNSMRDSAAKPTTIPRKPLSKTSSSETQLLQGWAGLTLTGGIRTTFGFEQT